MIRESPQSDLEQRELANAKFESVKAHIKRHGTRHMQITDDGRAVLDLSKLNLGDFYVVLVEKDEPAGFKDLDRGWVLQLPVLIERGNFDHLETRFGSVRKQFVHEMIHALDSTRFDVKDAQLSGYDNLGADYYNSGDELNAYYQEAVHDLESFLGGLPEDSEIPVQVLDIDDFELFQTSFFNQFFDGRAYDHLTSQNKRRLKKRLYKYWDEILS